MSDGDPAADVGAVDENGYVLNDKDNNSGIDFTFGR